MGLIGPELVSIMEHPCGVNINCTLNSTGALAFGVLMGLGGKHTDYTHIALEVRNVKSVQVQLEGQGFYYGRAYYYA